MNRKLKQTEMKKKSLFFHEFEKPGKLEIRGTKQLKDVNDLSLAYSPGVSFPCMEIFKDPSKVNKYTVKGNLIAVISNGTSVLGLGNIGALASKPVMEGKAILFKMFANIDAFDIEISQTDPELFIKIVSSLEPTFGGINLEDIKAPECFYIEKKLNEIMKIPVFHDDQHGTAIVCCAAVSNWIKITNKNIDKVKLVVSGAGAASLACISLLIKLGIKKNNIVVCDSQGVLYKGRDKFINNYKYVYAINDNGARKLSDVINKADIFLGCSRSKVLTESMVKTMANSPLIMALANPEPEIFPELVKHVRKDAIVCTGRSDYPNQVNNLLCFPFIFRGALDVGATTIDTSMKIACVKAIADLALSDPHEKIISMYENQNLKFGLDYIIPKPFDPRLITQIAPAVAKAAMHSGVATNPINDFDNYINKLNNFSLKNSSF